MKDFLIIPQIKIPILVAITKQDQAQGLMKKAWPPPFMAFPGAHEVKSFWMKDTPSPLDVLFCKGQEIIAIMPGIPFSEQAFGPKEKCDLVIETPRGFCEHFTLQPGDKIKLAYSLETMAKILNERYHYFDQS